MIMTRERPQQQEMLEKPRESFFGMKPSSGAARNSQAQRPTSVHTEFMETDWEMEDEEVVSEFEEDYSGGHSGENSPRVSLNSVCFISPLFKESLVFGLLTNLSPPVWTAQSDHTLLIR
jgi:hypothetical protein